MAAWIRRKGVGCEEVKVMSAHTIDNAILDEVIERFKQRGCNMINIGVGFDDTIIYDVHSKRLPLPIIATFVMRSIYNLILYLVKTDTPCYSCKRRESCMSLIFELLWPNKEFDQALGCR